MQIMEPHYQLRDQTAETDDCDQTTEPHDQLCHQTIEPDCDQTMESHDLLHHQTNGTTQPA